MNKIKIPFSEFEFSFSRSSGAGGQNVNKVNSKATLLWDPETTRSCPRDVLERFKFKYSKFLLDNGKIRLSSESHRSQKANIEECIKKLTTMINSVANPPKIRKATVPTRRSVLKRLESKKKDAEKKRSRSKYYE